MELCVYLYYFRQLIRMQTLSSGRLTIDEEVANRLLEQYIIPDNVTYHGEKCKFYYKNNNPRFICIDVPYYNRYRECNICGNTFIEYFDDYMMINLYRYINRQYAGSIRGLADEFKTCDYPMMGDIRGDILSILGKFYNNMLPYLCDNLKEQFASYIFITGMCFKGGGKNGT